MKGTFYARGQKVRTQTICRYIVVQLAGPGWERARGVERRTDNARAVAGQLQSDRVVITDTHTGQEVE